MTHNMHGGWNHSSDPHADHHNRIQYTLFGPTGNNGVVGNQAKLMAEIQQFKDWQKSINTTFITLRWVGLGVAFLLTIKAPPGFWDAVSGIIGVAKAVGAAG